MPVAIVCPSCNTKMKAPDNLIGKAVKCPTCAKAVLVKAPAAAAPPPAPVKKPVRPPAPVVEEEPIEDTEPVEDELDEPRPTKKKKGGSAGVIEGGPVSDKERSTAMWIYFLPYLLACCGGIGSFISLFMWISKRKESPFVDHHGKNWLNLAINCFVLSFVLGAISGVGQAVGGMINDYLGMGIGGLFGFLMFVEVVYFGLMMIISGFKAKGGQWYVPKMAFRLLK